MSTASLPEYWMRGPLEGVPALLQPVAHTLLQARDEVTAALVDFPSDLLWKRPAGMASPGFHLQHLRGVLDRLCTYAKGEVLIGTQLEALGHEGKEDPSLTTKILLDNFSRQVDLTLVQVAATDIATLTDFRGVGRRQLPSTVMGLLFHAAEHTMRHTGQLIVTVAVLKDSLL